METPTFVIIRMHSGNLTYLTLQINHHSAVSVFDKTSFHKVSWNREIGRSYYRIVLKLYRCLTSTLADAPVKIQWLLILNTNHNETVMIMATMMMMTTTTTTSNRCPDSGLAICVQSNNLIIPLLSMMDLCPLRTNLYFLYVTIYGVNSLLKIQKTEVLKLRDSIDIMGSFSNIRAIHNYKPISRVC